MERNTSIFEYESPCVDIITVEIEKGFAASGDMEGEIEDMPWG